MKTDISFPGKADRMAERAEKEAFVTLATNDTYALGCLVLGVSLRQQAKTTRKLVVMVTQGVSASMRYNCMLCLNHDKDKNLKFLTKLKQHRKNSDPKWIINQLAKIYDLIYDVNLLDSRDSANLQLLGRPDLSVTFTKLHCWRLTMFDKAVFLDADTLVLQNVDELFDREELSAAPDAGWPDCFNSGVFVFRPSEDTYKSLVDYAMSQGSFDGGDQGLLNMYFRDWATKDIARHLPFIYNVVSQAFYSYLPAFTQFKSDVKIVHFIGATKPWHHPYNTVTKKVKPLPETGHNENYLQIWWDLFMQYIQPTLDPTLKKNVTDTVNPYHHQISDRSSSNLEDGIHPPKFTFPAMIPYMPPSLDEVYYKPPPTPPPNESDKCLPPHESPPPSEVKEIPVVTRIYSELESHYSEEPLTNVNPDNPPTDIYDVPTVVQTWAAASENLSDECKKSTVHEDCVNSNCGDKIDNISNKTDEINDKQSEKQCSDGCENLPQNSHEDKKAGLVGELAALSIQSDGSMGVDQSLLSDSERKLNWEKGQMDYLGADKFENIQKKLDQSLQGPPEEAPSTTSSPFIPVKTTTTTTKVRSTATVTLKK